MTPEEIVKSLRACGRDCCDDCICDKEGLPCRAKNLGAAELVEQQKTKIAELEAKLPQWIPVTEKIPPDQEEVLVLTRSKNGVRNVDKGYWAIDRFIHRGRAEVTHWMPLPEVPKEAEAALKEVQNGKSKLD